jgi:hypothetical protein
LERSVKPSAKPTMVRTHHLPPPAETTPGQHECGQGLILPGAAICGSRCSYAGRCAQYVPKFGSRPLFVICSSMACARPRGAWWLLRSGAWPRVAARRCTWRRPAGARPRCGLPSQRPEALALPRSATSRPPRGEDRRGAGRAMTPRISITTRWSTPWASSKVAAACRAS